MESLQAIAGAANVTMPCQLVSQEDGSTIVPWTDFLAPRMKKITGINQDALL